MTLIEFIKELNEVLVVQETLVAPTKTSGIVVKRQGCPVRCHSDWLSTLLDLKNEELLIEQQHYEFVVMWGKTHETR